MDKRRRREERVGVGYCYADMLSIWVSLSDGLACERLVRMVLYEEGE